MIKTIFRAMVLFLFLSFQVVSVFGQDIPRVAVLDLDAKSFSREETTAVVDSLIAGLVGTKKFTVIARGDRDRILKEVAASLQESFDERYQIQIGRLLSATMIVAGSLSRADNKIVANFRLIDIQTAKIIQTTAGSYHTLSDLLIDCAALAGTLAAYSMDLSLTGTTWEFSLGDSITFLEGGIVIFNKLNATGKWKQNGNRVVFDCNSFTGYDVVINGDVLEGVWYRIAKPAETYPSSLARVKTTDEVPSPIRLPGSIWQLDAASDDIVIFYDNGLVVFLKRFATGAWLRAGNRLSIDVEYTTTYEIVLAGDPNRIEGVWYLGNNPKEKHPVQLRLLEKKRVTLKSKNIAGTTWAWQNGTTARFQKDGTAIFSHTEYTGHWKQTGDLVEFDLKVSGNRVFFSMFIFDDEMKGIFYRADDPKSLFHSTLTEIK